MVTMGRRSTETLREVQRGMSAHRWESRPKRPIAEHRNTPNRTKDISSTAEIETPGLSLNGAPKPMGRGCGRRPQERLIRVIKAHY